MDRAFEITTDLLMGKEVSDADKLWLQRRNAKYNIVRFLYMEKMKAEGVQLANFQFTPGDNFAETPTIDVVNALVKMTNDISGGDYETLDFGDATF